ncbi:MAG: ATPase [Schwartzia sp.]|jgi:16S rRNA G1207 methylase RsmC|nr:ATPase [Schwartzia sp. (in: firmicutes)]
MSVSTILDDIENLVVDAKRMPLTNSIFISESDLVRLLDNLRQELPNELANAQEIMDSRDEILNQARGESEQIISRAKDTAEQMIDESKIVQESKEKAELIMEQTKAQAKELYETSYQQARQLRLNANNYANQVFDHLILNVGNALEVLKQARDELQKMPVEPELPPAEPQPMAPAELPEE